MNQSSWEDVRRKERKKVYTRILILLPIFFFTGILIVNNRDLITSKKQIPAAAPSSVDSVPALNQGEMEDVRYPPDSTGNSGDTLLRKKETAKLSSIDSSVQIKKPREISAIQPLKRQPPERSVARLVPKPPKMDTIVSDRTDKVFSELLPPITCQLQRRKDIVIRLTLELFFRDEDTRAYIRSRRNDIKMIVMKNVLYNELGDMKIHSLEAQLQKSIGGLFGSSDVITLKISDIKLEKAIQ